MFLIFATLAVPFLGVVLGQNPCEPGKLPYVLHHDDHRESNRCSNFSDVCGENAYCVPRGASLIACVCLDGKIKDKICYSHQNITLFNFQVIGDLGSMDVTRTGGHFWKTW